jgi:hypothetical protein
VWMEGQGQHNTAKGRALHVHHTHLRSTLPRRLRLSLKLRAEIMRILAPSPTALNLAGPRLVGKRIEPWTGQIENGAVTVGVALGSLGIGKGENQWRLHGRCGSCCWYCCQCLC